MHGYRCDRVFDGERVLPGGALVLVAGGRIVDVRAGATPAPEGCPVDDLPGATLLPGLVDTHVHLCADGRPDALDHVPGRTPEELERVVRTSLRGHLRAGVTTVRDLGDHRWTVVDRAPRDDEPRVLAAGPPITVPGGHCWTMGGEARGRDALARAVRERADRGADVVKIMVSGGAMTAGSDLLALQYDAADLAFVVDRAHAAGLAVVAHAHPVAAVEACLAAGVAGIEHATCLTERGLVAPESLLRDLAVAGTWVCPTLGRAPGTEPSEQALAVMARTGYTYPARYAQVGRFAAAGVRLVSGSDAGIHPGKPHGVLAHAVAELVVGGVAPEAALRSATSAAADACGLSGVTGRIRAGLDADLLVVDGDPTADIGDLVRVRTVIRRGREVA